MKEVGLTNIYLDKILIKRCSDYVGIYSSNNIPLQVGEGRKKYSLICNLSEEGESGSHFITILVMGGRWLYYLDSLGLPCLSQHIMKWMTKQKLPIFHNSVAIQSANSLLCGYYCMLYVLLYDSNTKSPITAQFSKDYEDNDKKCVEYLISVLRRNKI